MIIKNIGVLAGIDESGRSRVTGAAMKRLDTIENAFLIAENGLIKTYGKMAALPAAQGEVIDAKGGVVLPAFCDSHTHIVYAGSREGEFVDKINGLSYEDIAKRGGGILNSAQRLQNATEDELFEQALPRLQEMLAGGAGSAEIKSGYGLTTKDEIKMLRVIKRLKEAAPLTIRATFLGAHAVPKEYKGRQGEYVDLICKEMIPAVAKENLAD
ncbi:MAG: imidazolonepropionase, partial [Elusimicrobiota bacterium]|nr:imidazolonepropionase [Elusimicrobiota bacterium]